MACYIYAGNLTKRDTHQVFHVYGRGSIYAINSIAWVVITLISIALGTPIYLNALGVVNPQIMFTIAFMCMSVGSMANILHWMHSVRKEQT